MSLRAHSMAGGVIAVLLLLVCGCQTTEEGAFPRIVNEPAPLPQQVRNGFGRLAILPPAASTNIHFARPPLPAAVAGRMATRTYAKMNQFTRDEDGKLEDMPARIAFNALVAASVGAVAGIVGGVSEDEFQRCQLRLRTALAEEPLEAGLENELRRLSAKHGGSNIVVLSEKDLAKIKFRGARADFSDLLLQGVDSVLDIRVGDIGFEYQEGPNPELAFTPEVTLYVLRTIDGAVLHASYLEYRGTERRFTTWASDDAKPFRIELNLAARAFAQSAVEQYFGVDARSLRGAAPAE
jgi:hypothetical protein